MRMRFLYTMSFLRLRILLCCILIVSGFSGLRVSAQSPTITTQVIQVKPLPNGIRVSSHGTILRVYTGANCHGDIYQDDGKTFAYRFGQFFRRHFTCEVTANHNLVIHIGAAQGSFTPWWNQLRIEALGWTPISKELTFPTGKLSLKQVGNAWIATVPKPPAIAAMDLTLE